MTILDNLAKLFPRKLKIHHGTQEIPTPLHVTVAKFGGATLFIVGAYYHLQGHYISPLYHLQQSILRSKMQRPQTLPPTFIPLTEQVAEDMRVNSIGRSHTFQRANKNTFKVIGADKAVPQGLVGIQPLFRRGTSFTDQLREGQELDYRERLAYMANMEEKQLVVFEGRGYEPQHMGHRALRCGAYLGLPHHFTYTEVSEVPESEVQSGVGAAALVLSPDAQKFCVARELCYLSTSPSYVWSQLLTLTTAIACSAACFMAPAITVLRAALAAVPLLLYPTAKSFNNGNMERKMDKLAASIGDEYARGGVEYYSKCVALEAALTTSLGDESAVRRAITPQYYDGVRRRVMHWLYYKPRHTAEERLQGVQDYINTNTATSADTDSRSSET